MRTHCSASFSSAASRDSRSARSSRTLTSWSRASRRWALPTIRSRSQVVASFSSGLSRPPTSAPRWALSVTSASRPASSATRSAAALREFAGSSATWSRSRSSWARSCLIRAADGVGAGHQGERRTQLGDERVGEPAGLGHRDRHAARQLARAVEATPDQRGDPLPLLLEHAAAVPGREDQLVAVGHRLPQRQRQHHVAGHLAATVGGEGRRIELVQLRTPPAHPLVERAQVPLDRGRLDGRPDRAWGAGCGDHGQAAVRRLRLGALAQGRPEPRVVAVLPRPVGPALLEHGVDEAHQVLVGLVDADAVGLGGELRPAREAPRRTGPGPRARPARCRRR